MDKWSENEFNVDEEEETLDNQNAKTTSKAITTNSKLIRDATERVINNSKKTGPEGVRRRNNTPYTASILMGPRGFRKLRQQTAQKIIPEINDINDPVISLDLVIRDLRDWSHHMYPKYVFRDWIDKTERICRDSSMRGYINSLNRGRETTAGNEGEDDEIVHDDFDEVEYAAEQNAAEAKAALGITD